MIGLLLCGLYAFAALKSAGERQALLDAEAIFPAASLSLGTARTLLKREPGEPRSVAALGTALVASGDPAAAERSFEVAREFGWRNPDTQIYWADRELRRSNYSTAARHLDALLRQHPLMAARLGLLHSFESDPGGRTALAALMMPSSEWVWRYTLDWSGMPAPQMLGRAMMLKELARQKRPIGCLAAVGPAEGLISIKAFPQARELWRDHCPDRRGGPLGDGNFIAASFEGKGGPFSWTFFPAGDVSARFERAGGQARQLVAANSGATVLPLAAQMLVAAPGAYRLTWRGDASRGALVAAIGCQPGGGVWQSASFDGRTAQWFVDLAIDSSCQAPWLTFGIAPRNGDAVLGRVAMIRR